MVSRVMRVCVTQYAPYVGAYLNVKIDAHAVPLQAVPTRTTQVRNAEASSVAVDCCDSSKDEERDNPTMLGGEDPAGCFACLVQNCWGCRNCR